MLVEAERVCLDHYLYQSIARYFKPCGHYYQVPNVSAPSFV